MLIVLRCCLPFLYLHFWLPLCVVYLSCICSFWLPLCVVCPCIYSFLITSLCCLSFVYLQFRLPLCVVYASCIYSFWLPLCVVCPSFIYTSDYTNTVYSNLLIFPFGIIEENGCLLYWEKFEDTKEVIISVNARRTDNTKR
jgi:hypothetical protein